MRIRWVVVIGILIVVLLVGGVGCDFLVGGFERGLNMTIEEGKKDWKEGIDKLENLW